MAKNKTTETQHSVSGFLNTIKDEKRRNDCTAIIDLITENTGLEPKMWGTAIVGFGIYHYRYESGREGNAPLVSFSPRSAAIVFYLSANLEKRNELLQGLGKHKTDKGCIYIQKLEDIDTGILIKMISNSIEYYRSKYPG